MSRIPLLFSLALTALLTHAAPLPREAELLARNSVLAVYEKTEEHPCRFRTALCPDRCGHASTLAQFRVCSNESYEKPGQYGDDKVEVGSTLLVDVGRDIPGQDAAVARKIAALHPGDKVRLTVSHYYVQEGGMHYPVRPVTSFELLPPPTSASAATPVSRDLHEPLFVFPPVR